MDAGGVEKDHAENYSVTGVVEDVNNCRSLSTYVGIASAFAVLGLLIPRPRPSNDKLRGAEWEAEKNKLVIRTQEAEAKVEEMKKQRSEDAKANEKVAAMFAARRQHWKTEKNKLKMQVEMLLNQESCKECGRKDEAISGLEEKSHQLDLELGRAFERIESCERECKLLFQEKEEIKERLTSEIVKLQKDVEEKGEIICSLLRKSEEKEELDRELAIAEAKRNQGDWTGLEKSLHVAHIKQRRLQDLDAFERQMKAKDERMEAFRQKLLLMENTSAKLRVENESLHKSLQQAEVKITRMEALLEEKHLVLKPASLKLKSKATCPCERGFQKSEDSKYKVEKVEEEETAAGFEGVEDSETKYEEKQFRSCVAEADRSRPQREYENLQRQGFSSFLGRADSRPKTYLGDSHFVWSCYDNAMHTHTVSETCDEESDHFRPVEENVHLKSLIEQATQAFQITGLGGAHHIRQEKVEKQGPSFPQTYRIERDVSEPESTRRDDLPAVVDKHVSETLRAGTVIQSQAEPKFVCPVKFQPGLGFLAEWEKGRAMDSEAQVTLLGHDRESNGKTVAGDNYQTYKMLGRALENVRSGKEAEEQITEQRATCLRTAPAESFCARKDGDLSFDSKSYLKHILQGRDSSWKEVGVVVISSEVKRLEQELLQLEKIAKTEVSKRTQLKDGKSIMNINKDNGNEKQQVETNRGPLSAIRLLKKQVKRYQGVIGKLEELCRRMRDNNSAHTIDGSRTREQITEQELFLMETFQHQHYVVAMGQKLTAIQAEIARNSSALNNDLTVPDSFNMRQSIFNIKSHLKDIQRSLEIKLARIIGDLEGTLARDGILHVMPVEWKKERKAMFVKSKNESRLANVKQ